MLWAIAYQYISELTYCANPKEEPTDYCLDTMKDFEEDLDFSKGYVINTIQLKHHPKMELPRSDFDESYARKFLRECQKDPKVPFTIISTIEDVEFHGDFDFVVMA